MSILAQDVFVKRVIFLISPFFAGKRQNPLWIILIVKICFPELPVKTWDKPVENSVESVERSDHAHLFVFSTFGENTPWGLCEKILLQIVLYSGLFRLPGRQLLDSIGHRPFLL